MGGLIQQTSTSWRSSKRWRLTACETNVLLREGPRRAGAFLSRGGWPNPSPALSSKVVILWLQATTRCQFAAQEFSATADFGSRLADGLRWNPGPVHERRPRRCAVQHRVPMDGACAPPLNA